ncbi:MAG: isochorismate synthase [Halanaeroarchaeum sp.]
MASRDGQETVQETRLASRTVSLPPTSLRDVLRMDRPVHAAWTAPGEPTLVASGSAISITADDAKRIETVREKGVAVFDRLDEDVPAAARPRFLGGFAFHDRHDGTPPWTDFPGAWFVLPTVQVVLADDGGWITVTADSAETPPNALRSMAEAVREGIVDGGPVGGPPGVDRTERETTYDQWTDQLQGAIGRIEAGDLEKVTLAQTLGADLGSPFPLAATLERLGEVYPDCYRFAFRPGAGRRDPTPAGTEPEPIPTFFGASPERLVSKHDDGLVTGALASTVARGETAAQDEQLATELLTDQKFDREHEVVVESIKRQLEAVAAGIETGERTVRQLDAVQHLYTPIEGTSTADHVLDVVTALHPTPAVGGLPPDVALDTIRRTETFDRGWYAAPVGWFDADGDGTFAVGIRSAVADDATATLFAGNGIVADSDPDAEWNEVQLKYRPILDALR